jgi:hypothetical protein
MQIKKTGQVNVPPKILIYGPEGVGKSTFGALAPNPIFIQTEDGLDYIETSALPLVESWDIFQEQLEYVQSEEAAEFKTVVIDSVDWLERLVHNEVASKAGVTKIEEIGYGKGFLTAGEMLQDTLLTLSAIQKMGKIVILVAHAKIEKFQDPTGEAYDRYSPSLGKKASSVCREWADDILFMNFKVTKKTIEGSGFAKDKKVAAIAERCLYSSDKPAYLAKSRSGIPEMIEVGDNAWLSYAAARKEARASRLALKQS